MRPGRLDRILYIGPPDQEGRKEILRIRTVKMSVEPGLDIEELARLVGVLVDGEIIGRALMQVKQLWRAIVGY